MSRLRLSWWVWGVGCVLVALSWVKMVSYEVGFVGFLITVLASVIGWTSRPSPPPKLENGEKRIE